MKSRTLLKWHNIAILFTTFLLLFTACGDDDNDSSSDNKNPDPPRPTTEANVFTDTDLRKEMLADSNVTWKDTIIINGPVYVQDDEVLTIQAGSVIKGRAKAAGETASALIIARGGKIMAEGTSQAPIIFTYETDPLDGTTSPTTRGRWGGVIILGKAELNSEAGETAIEGIPTGETRALYGGEDDTDNSGVLRYISIRHGGAVIGAGNEINGLTLGGVGSETTLEYIEIVGSQDDGIELFGGTANIRYLISAYNQDDAVDYDEGYRGFCQFVIIHQDPATEAADRGFECDGGTTPEDGRPFATPMFVNVTVRGNSGKRVASVRDNAGGFFYNALFTGSEKGIDIEKAPGAQHSYKQLLDDNLVFRSNAFGISSATIEEAYKITEGDPPVSSPADQAALEKLNGRDNTVGLTVIFKTNSSIPSTTTGFPSAYLVTDDDLGSYPNNGHQQADYIGAVDPSTTNAWYKGWSFYDPYILRGE